MQGTAQILIAHSLHTFLSPEKQEDILSDALIDLVSLGLKPSTLKNMQGIS
jgi:hypothetical protein